MSQDGWIPLALIFNFNAMVKLHCNYQHLKQLLQLDPLFDLDAMHDRMRLKNYHQWVLPGSVPSDVGMLQQVPMLFMHQPQQVRK